MHLTNQQYSATQSIHRDSERNRLDTFLTLHPTSHPLDGPIHCTFYAQRQVQSDIEQPSYISVKSFVRALFSGRRALPHQQKY